MFLFGNNIYGIFLIRKSVQITLSWLVESVNNKISYCFPRCCCFYCCCCDHWGRGRWRGTSSGYKSGWDGWSPDRMLARKSGSPSSRNYNQTFFFLTFIYSFYFDRLSCYFFFLLSLSLSNSLSPSVFLSFSLYLSISIVSFHSFTLQLSFTMNLFPHVIRNCLTCYYYFFLILPFQ